MFILKNYKNFLYFCALLTTPLLTQAQVSNRLIKDAGLEQNEKSLEFKGYQSHFRSSNRPINRLKLERKIRPLKLADFAGSWVLTETSVGGVDGGEGTSLVLNMQFTTDRHGKSHINFFTTSYYEGDDRAQFFSYDPNFAKITFEILDARHGIGQITAEFLDRPGSTSSFIVTRSPIDGKVIKMDGMSNDTSTDTTNIRAFTITRQYPID